MNVSGSWVRASAWSLAIVLLTVSCQRGDSTSDDAAQEERTTSVVDTVTLNETDFTEYIDLTGVTEPVQSATLSAEVAGRITQYDLQEGQHVTKGETLVRVDVGQKSAQIKQFQAQLDELDTDIARTKRLLERGLASQQKLDQLTTQRATTYQSMRGVRIGVRNARIRAPFAGVVLSESAELGEYAGPGEQIARIGDLSTVKVVVNLPEREIRYVKEGERADVSIPALDESFKGTVTRIGMETNESNRSFPVEIHIDNSKGRIRAGMRADALLHKNRIRHAIVVPRDVLREGSVGREAVVAEDGKAVVRQVLTGTSYQRYIVVLSGLNVGDELVIRGQRELIAGELVAPTNQGTCCSDQIHKARQAAGLSPDTADEGTKGTETAKSAGHNEEVSTAAQ